MALAHDIHQNIESSRAHAALASHSFALVCLAGLGSVALPGCGQSPMLCTSARGDYAVRYELVDGDDGACSELVGELVGFQTHGVDKNGNLDPTEASVSIRAEKMGLRAHQARDADAKDENEDHEPFAFGPFTTSFPDADEHCAVETLSEAHQDFPEATLELEDEDGNSQTIELDPIKMTYEWSDLTFLVSPASQGTSFIGSLKYSEGDDCTAEYKVFGLYPAVSCEEDEDCYDPSAGLNSDLINEEKLYCDEDLGMCAKTEDTP